MEASHDLVAVAFVRSAGGRVRLLLCVDRDGEQLCDGEPVLLAEHAPGSAWTSLSLEGPDAMSPAAVDAVRAAGCRQLAVLVEDAFDAEGGFDGQRMLGRSVRVMLPADTFEM